MSSPSPSAVTVDPTSLLPTNSTGVKKTYWEKQSKDKRWTAKLTVTAGVKYVELPNIEYLKAPLDTSVHGVSEVTRKGGEWGSGSKYDLTGTLGLKFKVKLPSFLPDLSVTHSPGFLDLRTGEGRKVEANIGITSLPSLTITDSSSQDVRVRYEGEKERARELIQSSRRKTMGVISETAREHEFSPITGEGMDEQSTKEFLDKVWNVGPGARQAMVERNQTHGEGFKHPLSEPQINQIGSSTHFGQYEQVLEKFWHGENGKDGRLAPKQGRVEESPPNEGTSLEKAKVEGSELTGAQKSGQEPGDGGLTVDSQPKEDMESSHVPSVREKMGSPSTSKGSGQENSLEKGKSVRDNVQVDSGTQKSSTGPKLSGK